MNDDTIDWTAPVPDDVIGLQLVELQRSIRQAVTAAEEHRAQAQVHDDAAASLEREAEDTRRRLLDLLKQVH